MCSYGKKGGIIMTSFIIVFIVNAIIGGTIAYLSYKAGMREGINRCTKMLSVFSTTMNMLINTNENSEQDTKSES